MAVNYVDLYRNSIEIMLQVHVGIEQIRFPRIWQWSVSGLNMNRLNEVKESESCKSILSTSTDPVVA